MRGVVTSDHNKLFPLANFLKNKEVVNASLLGEYDLLGLECSLPYKTKRQH